MKLCLLALSFSLSALGSFVAGANPLSPETVAALKEAHESKQYDVRVVECERFFKRANQVWESKKQTLVLLGEVHLKDRAAKELGNRIVQGFDLIGAEGVPISHFWPGFGSFLEGCYRISIPDMPR